MSCSTHSGYRNSGEYISDTESTVCSEGSPRRSTFSLHKFVQSLSRRKLSNPENNAKLPQYHGRRRGGVMVGNPDDKDAFHVAARHKNEDALALLIWSGADKSGVDRQNKTALQVAKEVNKNGSHDRIIELLAA